MAQTLEELFKSKQLQSQGGKTAAVAYDIQNSKDIRISTTDLLVNNTGFAAARLLRKVIGIRRSETLLEEELTGIRIIRGLSTPVIYGNELTRITLRTTPMLDAMKKATSGELSDSGAIGGKISKLRDSVNSKLGIPTGATPTYVVGKLMAGGTVGTEAINLGLTQDRMNDLAAIRKSAEGSLLGQFLKGLGGGNLKTIGKQALGAAINLGKAAIRNKLFGSSERTGLEIKGTVIVKGSVSGFTNASTDFFGVVSTNYGFDKDAIPSTKPENGQIDAKGASYTKTIFPEKDTPKDRNDLSYKQELEFKPIIFSKEPDKIGKFSESKKQSVWDKGMFLETDKRGMYTNRDIINELGVNEINEDIDFVSLIFQTTAGKHLVQFRGTITGLTETTSPSWDSNKFIGSPFNYYTYTGIERSVSFNFKVFSLNEAEHTIAWKKLDALTGMAYPTAYSGLSVTPPLMKFTIGNLYKAKAAFIESLSYTIDDNYPWEIKKGKVLPMIVDVAITMKFIESKSSTNEKSKYAYT
tara:strand:- start:4199 stop:5773 length:1575 start_codon:yes stop_codon:yes gene_type:complete